MASMGPIVMKVHLFWETFMKKFVLSLVLLASLAVGASLVTGFAAAPAYAGCSTPAC